MRTLHAAALSLTGAAILVTGLTGCQSAATADMVVGDCLKVGGTPDRPTVSKVECAGPDSNFKVVATAPDTDGCPTDVDSYYSMHSTFSDNSETICMDIDWVVGGCMSIDPENDRDPIRVDCGDSSVEHRQRATEILSNVASVDQCATGVGYPYDERQFTVCVEDVA